MTPPEPLPGARLLFSLDPGLAHLNHGSLGAVPIPVQRAQQRLRDEMEANPLAFNRGVLDRLIHARRHIATYLGADPDGTALVPNVTAAIATVLNSLRLEPGDEILLTDHGYGAVLYACERTAKRAGATVREVTVPLTATEDDVVTILKGALTSRTRLAIVDQVTSQTARPFPVARLAPVLRERGVRLLVDAAHVPGAVPVNVAAIGADYWTGNLHKWAYAPRGTGVLAVAPEHRASVESTVVSWRQPYGFPTAVEFGGTLDYTGWLAAPVGLFVLRSLGEEAVRAHNAALVGYGQGVMAAALDAEPPDIPGVEALPMRILPLPRGTVADEPAAMALHARISVELNCEVLVTAWRDRSLLRLSAQVYNRPEDYVRLAEGLPALLRQLA